MTIIIPFLNANNKRDLVINNNLAYSFINGRQR
jgi:hypothetical protein